jgi:diacylglycerol kinase (ATP)
VPKQPDILVIVNPVSGGGRALRAQPLVAGFFEQRGLRADFVRSQSTNDLRERAAQGAAAGYRCIIALGGDGAFHHLVEGVFGSDVTLGFLPAGNGNDIAEALNIPKDPIAAADVFMKTEARPMDVLRARFASGRTALYVGAGGMGLDAEAAGLANERFRHWPGVTRYLAGALWALARFPLLEVNATISTDSETAHWKGQILLAAVANAPCYGSGFRIAPGARVDDGLLDILLAGTMPWARVVEALPILLRTGDLRWNEVHRYRATRIRLEADRPALFHGDGELLGEAPVEVEVLPAAIRVVAPQPVPRPT